MNATGRSFGHSSSRRAKPIRQSCAVTLAAWITVPLACCVTTHAATVTVCDEPNLRTAIQSGGLVNFACDGTIVLTNEITISQDTTLDANGHAVTISGNNAVRVFMVDSGITAQ
jgi:hypothetical protein